jgi:hypothetical protein
MDQEKQIHAYMRELWERAKHPAVTVPPFPATVPPEYTRDPAFCRVVRDAYDFRCAASGWRILLPDGCPMSKPHISFRFQKATTMIHAME